MEAATGPTAGDNDFAGPNFERLVFRIEPTADFIEKYGETCPDSGRILQKLSNVPVEIEQICSVGTIARNMYPYRSGDLIATQRSSEYRISSRRPLFWLL